MGEEQQGPRPFAVLGLAPRPWLRAEEIEEAFRSRMLELHPDRTREMDDQVMWVTEARRILLSIPDRLEALEGGGKPASAQIPSDLAELLFEAGAVQQDAKRLLVKLAEISPIERALLADEVLMLSGKIEVLVDRLNAAWEASEAELRRLDREWDGPQGGSFAKVRELKVRFRFLQRWREQLEETRFELVQSGLS